MPKKTKREKIIAEYHRKLSRLHEILPNSNQHESQEPLSRQEPPPSPYAYRANTSSSGYEVHSPQPMDHVIRRDLIKTLILAGLAIGGEIVLAWTLK